MVTGGFIQLIIHFYTQNFKITFVQLPRKLHTVDILNLIVNMTQWLTDCAISLKVE